LKPTSSPTEGDDDYYVDDDIYIDDTSFGIYTSKNGKIVISSDSYGNVYRSSHYGEDGTWTYSKALEVSGTSKNKVYGSIEGLVMSSTGEEMVVSTNYNGIFYSSDYGHSFTKVSSYKCSLMAASDDLSGIICIHGNVYEQNHLIYSYDKGVTWSISEGSYAKWSGVATNSDFSVVIAVRRYSENYTWHSTNKGRTFTLICSDELNKWGQLCASRDLETMMLTDSKTKNVHVSMDQGYSWSQIFNSDDSLHSNATVMACSISPDGYTFGLAFKDADTYISHGCDPAVDIVHCRDSWIHLEVYSNPKDYDSSGIALSNFGDYFFTVDSTKNEIVRAEKTSYDY